MSPRPPSARSPTASPPFLGVERKADRWSTALGEKIPEFQDVEGDGR